MRPFARFFCYFFVTTCANLGLQDRRMDETRLPLLSHSQIKQPPPPPIRHFVQDEPQKVRAVNNQPQEEKLRTSIKNIIIPPKNIGKIDSLNNTSTEKPFPDMPNVTSRGNEETPQPETTAETSTISLADPFNKEAEDASEIASNIQPNDVVDLGEIKLQARSLFSNQNQTSGNSLAKNRATEKVTIKNPDAFTQAEREALDKFRPQVINLITRDYEKSDAYLLPWLRVQNLNVAKAVNMVRETQKWRSQNRVDEIVNETIFTFKSSPYLIDGYDREGHPIVMFTPTAIDLRKLLVIQGSFDKAYRYGIQVVESGMAKRREASLKFGKEITQVVVIIDLTGFNLRQHTCFACVPILRDWIIGFEKYYPDAAKYLIAINVPRIALPVIDLFKPFASERLLKSLKIFGTDRTEWTKFLHTIIAPDQLPYKFGGTKYT